MVPNNAHEKQWAVAVISSWSLDLDGCCYFLDFSTSATLLGE